MYSTIFFHSAYELRRPVLMVKDSRIFKTHICEESSGLPK